MYKKELIALAGLSLGLILGPGAPDVHAGSLTGRSETIEAVVLAKDDVVINASTFPDTNFRNYVVEQIAGGDYVLTKAEKEACTSLSITGRSITSLKGIEHFTRLTFLNCSNNLIRTLDTTGLTELTVLYCDNNELSSLKLDTSTRLEELVCYNNQLSSLSLPDHSRLKVLKCYQNQLTELEISSCSGLTGLYCQKNLLETLPLTTHPDLVYLNCGDNQLRELHTDSTPALMDLHCYGNLLSSLDLTGNTALKNLYCYSNSLTALDLAANTALNYLDCRDNLLDALDISHNPELLHVNCDKNRLRILDSSSNPDLLSLYYSENRMGNADISANTELLSFSGRNQTILTESDALDMLSYHSTFRKDRTGSIQGLTLSENTFHFNEGKRTGSYHYHAGTVQNAERKLSVSLRQPAMTIQGLVQPAAGGIPEQDSVTASYNDTVYTIREILWNPAPDPVFLADTIYTADLIIAPSEAGEFTDSEYVVIEDTLIPAVRQEDGSLKVSYTFPKTTAAAVSALTVQNLPALTPGQAPDTGSLRVFFDDTDCRISQLQWTPVISDTVSYDTEYQLSFRVACEDPNYVFTEQTIAQSGEIRLDTRLNADGSLTLTYSFPKTESDAGDPTDPDNPDNPTDPDAGKIFPFTDVPQIDGSWKYESVKYVYFNNIMNGISGTTLFQPDQPLTRAMFATVLYRMAGNPEVTFTNTFKDVRDPDTWYSKAILWASREKIVEGYSDGNYGINDNVTREQIAKMLYLYGESMGYDVSDQADLSQYTDVAKVSSWASQCMKWAVAVEMITGKNNSDGTRYLDPKGDATRAECAAILMRFQNKYTSK